MPRNPVPRPHHTDTVDRRWSGPATERRLANNAPERTLRKIFAWVDPNNPESETAAKFPHHEVAAPACAGPANTRAARNGISILNGGRGGADIPDGDRAAVYRHLATHMRDAGIEPPRLKK